MKFISLQENLKQGLLVVSHATGKNVNLPILGNILIRAKEGEIQLVSTNLEIGITHTLRGKIEKDGEFTVSSKVITDYVNLLPSQKINLEEKEEELAVECENYKTKIKGQSAQEFPLIPSVEKDKYYEIKADDLKKALAQVVFAVSNNELRLELSGILFTFTKENLILASTDSYRLAERKIKIKTNDGEGKKKVIVPAKTVQDLIRIISLLNDFDKEAKQTENIKIYISDNQILFALDSTELISRTISGQYPDYQQIIPSDFKTEVVVDRQELIRAIKATSIFTKTGINDVSLVFLASKKSGTISSASGQTGESLVDIKCDVKGTDNEIVVNFRYLLDGLNNIDSKRIKLEIINNSTPCLLQAEGESEYLYIIMPIRQ